jgi:hypothetical protein
MFLYKVTVTDFGHPEQLGELPFALDFSFFIGGIVSAVVQVRRKDVYN